jgi:VanZ family protein
VIERRWLPPLAWAGCILIATSIPGRYIPRVEIREADKAVHWVLYGIFAVLLYNALPRRVNARAITVIGVIIAFAALDEFHQKFIPGRSMDIEDWFADVGGAMVFLLVATFIQRRRESRV